MCPIALSDKYFISKYQDRKGFAEDLTEGKFSFLMVRALTVASQAIQSQLLNILRQKPTDVDIKKYAIDLLNNLDVFTYTEEYLRQLENQARAEIIRLGGNRHLESIMDLLSLDNKPERQ